MPLTVIAGGQFGSEGKEKICAQLSLNDVDAVVRCGSTNSGHTVIISDQKWELRLIPAGFVHPRTTLMLPAGAIIDPRILLKEIKETGVTRTGSS
jgi:adenylosuccinate synthase